MATSDFPSTFYEDLKRRIISHVEDTDAYSKGCWKWKGYNYWTTDVRYDEMYVTAHRASYIAFDGKFDLQMTFRIAVIRSQPTAWCLSQKQGEKMYRPWTVQKMHLIKVRLFHSMAFKFEALAVNWTAWLWKNLDYSFVAFLSPQFKFCVGAKLKTHYLHFPWLGPSVLSSYAAIGSKLIHVNKWNY
jgi:hypothetical protein